MFTFKLFFNGKQTKSNFSRTLGTREQSREGKCADKTLAFYCNLRGQAGMKIFQNGLLKCKHVKRWARTGFSDYRTTSVILFSKHIILTNTYYGLSWSHHTFILIISTLQNGKNSSTAAYRSSV